MYFTQEDYKKIETWLYRNSVKDSEFQEALPFTGKETVTIVQDGHNRKVNIKEFIEQLFNINAEDFININRAYDVKNITLREAIALVPDKARKEGQVITFLNEEGNWGIFQFVGKLNQWNNISLWKDPYGLENLVVNSILPDEEDLTKTSPDKNGNVYLSFKDRQYDPTSFSGLGRKILRKNILEVQDPKYGTQTKNVLTQADFANENTVYVIRYDFDLDNEIITLPTNSVLYYEGGSISNGTFVCQNTTIKGIEIVNNITLTGDYKYYPAKVDNEDIVDTNGILSLKDRDSSYGMGYVILRKNKTFAEQVTKANTIYEIRYDFDLNNKSIDLPSGCIINFVGGNLSNGTIKGNVIVCGKHSSQMVFVDGYNLNEPVVISSNIGLIANNADAASHNTAILAKCIALNKTLSLDDTYHFNSNNIEINGAFSIVGNGKLITSRSGYFFILKENASLELNGIEIDSQAERFISGENLGYQIDSLCMTHCRYRGRRLAYITFKDLDFSTTSFGFKKFVFEDNDVESEGSYVTISDAVISEICSIRRNHIQNMKYSCFFFGATEDFVNCESNIKKWCDVYVEDNVVDGGISTDAVSYCTFLLIEANSVYYRRNVIKNVLGVGTGVAYDAYVSSWKYVSEDNVFENIACIPPTGTPKDTADEFGKGKQRCELRYFRNNRWKNDYAAIRRILADYLTGLDDETYRSLCYVALFAYVAPVKELIFKNNTIEVIDGDLWGTRSTVEIERSIIENNNFFCDTKYSLFSTKDGNIEIRNNIFKGTSERTDYNLIMSAGTIQSIIVENNVFDLSWRVNESLKAKNVYVKNNTYANLKGIKGHVYIPNGEDSSDFEYVWHTDEADKKIFCSNGRIICPKESAAIRRLFSTKKENVKIDITIPRIDVKLSYIFKVENGTTKIYDVDGNLLYTPTSQLGYTLYEKNGIRFWGSAASNGFMEFYLLIQKQQDVIVDINSRDVTFNQVQSVGLQANRPNVNYITAGYQYYDKTLGKPIWYNGTSWVDATGANV